MPAPDPNSFGYADGPDAMCAVLDKTMSARGYLLVSGRGEGKTGAQCRLITPGISRLEVGSHDLRVEIGVWKDNVAEHYAGLQEQVVEQNKADQKSSDIAVSKVERFPSGTVVTSTIVRARRPSP